MNWETQDSVSELEKDIAQLEVSDLELGKGTAQLPETFLDLAAANMEPADHTVFTDVAQVGTQAPCSLQLELNQCMVAVL